jgi:hypothetical protein
MNFKLKNKAIFCMLLLTPLSSFSKDVLPEVDIMENYVDTTQDVLDTELDELTDVKYIENVGKDYNNVDNEWLLQE